MIEVINKRSHYDPESITIEWSDVVSKIANDHQTSTCRVLYDKEEPITLVCHNDYRPGTVQKAFDSVEGYDQMHVYISFGETTNSFGSHCDEDDVLLVQSVGEVSYVFENEQSVRLRPGDSLFIPAGVYHKPIVHEPRITLSFS